MAFLQTGPGTADEVFFRRGKCPPMTETTMERIPPVAVKDMRAMWNFLRGVESRVGGERGSVFVGEGAWRAAFGDRDLSAVNRRCVRLDITTRAYGIDIDKWPSLFR